MPILMIPGKLWRRFGLPGKPPAAPDDHRGRLGHWSLAGVATRVGELALFVNQRTCLTAVTPMAPLPILLGAFGQRLADELERQGLPPPLVEEELAAVAGSTLGKNVDRSLLGTVNDLTWHAQLRAEKSRTLASACDDVQAELNQTPHTQRRPCFPYEALAELCAIRH